VVVVMVVVMVGDGDSGGFQVSYFSVVEESDFGGGPGPRAPG
jgi:hypothetical protein